LSMPAWTSCAASSGVISRFITLSLIHI
jgi:hypothetical protein